MKSQKPVRDADEVKRLEGLNGTMMARLDDEKPSLGGCHCCDGELVCSSRGTGKPYRSETTVALHNFRYGLPHAVGKRCDLPP